MGISASTGEKDRSTHQPLQMCFEQFRSRRCQQLGSSAFVCSGSVCPVFRGILRQVQRTLVKSCAKRTICWRGFGAEQCRLSRKHILADSALLLQVWIQLAVMSKNDTQHLVLVSVNAIFHGFCALSDINLSHGQTVHLAKYTSVRPFMLRGPLRPTTRGTRGKPEVLTPEPKVETP